MLEKSMGLYKKASVGVVGQEELKKKKKREIQKEEWCTKIKFKKKVPKKRKYKMRYCCEKKKEKRRKRKGENPKRNCRKIIG